MPTLQELLERWNQGGWVMIPLFLLSSLLYFTAFQLLLYVYRTNISRTSESLWKSWIEDPENAQGRVGQIIRYTQDGVRSAKQVRNRFDEVRMSMLSMIDRRTQFLASLVATAPLMGLLGTVLGMLNTFASLAGGGSETAANVAGGISEALQTTMTGLVIALPGLFVTMVVRRKKHAIEADIALLETMTLTHLEMD